MKSLKKVLDVLFGIALLAVGGASAVEKVTYYHNDALGSPVAATNEQGQLLWTESYEPYGTRLTNPTSNNALWYTGKHEEAELGLNYFGARWYEAGIGRFHGVDPVGFSAKNIQSFNRYAYANNNPYHYVDPDGKTAIAAADIAVVGAGLFLGYQALTPEQKLAMGESVADVPASWIRMQIYLMKPFMNDGSEGEVEAEEQEKTQSPGSSNGLDGEPGTCSTCNNKKGDIKQDRYYGPDGWPVKDIDYDHNHKGADGKKAGKPHVHDWGRPADGSRPTSADRGPARSPKEGEI